MATEMWKPWALVRGGKSSMDVQLTQVVDLSLQVGNEVQGNGMYTHRAASEYSKNVVALHHFLLGLSVSSTTDSRARR